MNLKQTYRQATALFEALLRNPDDVDLQHAAVTGDAAEVARLLRSGSANPNTRDLSGWTPLHYACLGGHRDVVRLLLDEGADPTKRTDKGYLAREIANREQYGELSILLRSAEAKFDGSGPSRGPA
jgi:ankyrin repeat protein